MSDQRQPEAPPLEEWRSSATDEPLADRLGRAREQLAAGSEAAAQAVEDLEPEREAPNINDPELRPALPIPEPRGDEHLCARCASHPGEDLDAEGRLLCTHCLAEVEAPG